MNSLRLRPTLLAFALLSVVSSVYLVSIGQGLGNSDEVLYAEFIRAMHRTGDYVSLRYHGALHMQRPPWPFSLYALVAKVVPGEYGLRLLPTLFTIATGACLLVLVRRWNGDEAGLAALLLFAAIPSVYCYGRALLSDPPFVFAIVLAVWATIGLQRDPRLLLHAAAALGLAFAAKSVAAAIPALGLGPGLLVAVWRHRRSPKLRLGRAVLAFTALAAPFYVLSVIRFGRHFVDVHIGVNLLDRTQGKLEGLGMGGVTAYLEHMWRFDGPALTVLLVGGVLAAAALAIAKRDATLGVPATLAGTVLVCLSAVKTRLPHYLLAFYPAAIVCVASVAAHFTRPPRTPIVRWLAPAVAFTLFTLTIAQPTTDGFLSPSREARQLGEAYKLASPPPSMPAYTVDWYAPAFAYYAERPWKLLTTDERMARIVGAVDTLADAGTVKETPPWPNGRWLAAGPKDRLLSDYGLNVLRIVAEAGEYVLVEVAN